jgi:hypothetical protein
MKNINTLILTLVIINSALTQEIYSTFGPNASFVQGIEGVINDFSLINTIGDEETVIFYASDVSGNTVYDSYTDNDYSDGFNWYGVDMGLLPPDVVIWAAYYDINGNLINYTADFLLFIIPTPSWIMNGGQATNVTVTGNVIDFDAELPLLSSSSNEMPDDMPGLGTRPYDINYSSVKIHIQYDVNQYPSIIGNPLLYFELNVFDQTTIPYEYELSDISDVSIDNLFNLKIITSGSVSTQEFEINCPAFRFPVGVLPMAIKIDGGFKFNADLYGQIVLDYDNQSNSFGFIEINGDQTKIVAKINGEGTLRVSADALVANVGGSIIARGSIGGGFKYISNPLETISPLFGLDFEIAGALDYKLGIGLLSQEGRIEKVLYQKTFGDQLKMPVGSHLIYDNVDAMGAYTATVEKDAAFEVQDFFAQPAFSANDNYFYTVWLDYEEEKQKILFSELNYGTGSFGTPLEVITNRDVISNPKVAILPSGAALITWTESRYNSSNFDTSTMELQNILNAQDIWATIYDNTTNSFTDPFRLSDDISDLETGRADGNANIVMGKGNYGLIVWTAADIENNTSDIYFSTVQETGSSWIFSNADLLTDLPGTNRSVNVAYIDSLTAIASWINDPDGTDSTYNSQVVYQVWDGSSWSATQSLVQNDGTTNFDELSMDFNDIYGAICFTSTIYDEYGNFEKQIQANAWDNSNNIWGEPYIDSDSMYYFAKPRVSVNKNGLTALTYQALELFSDTLNPDEGILYMLLNNAQNVNNWVENTESTTLGDPNVYVADLVTSFDNGNNLYAITQEADEQTGLAPMNPVNGIRFGNNYLNLVLRGFSVNSDLSIEGIEEPTAGETSDLKTYEKDFVIANVFPNPFSTQTTIKYTLRSQAKVNIEIVDYRGVLVKKLFEGELNEGIYNTVFEPGNIAEGVYYCNIKIDDYSVTKKIVLIK